MKPKALTHCKSDILRRAIQPASALFKKKELKKFSTKKKTVRFNLSAHLSTSELLLADSKVFDALNPDAHKDQKLTSKSTICIATSSNAIQPVHKLHSTSFFDHTGQSLGKRFHSLADLYMWEPIIHLKKSHPVKGILKEAVSYDRFNNNCGSYPSHSNILLARDSFHKLESKKRNRDLLSSCPGECDDGMFDSLTSSIQDLQISAFSPGFLNPGVSNEVTSRQQGFTCSQIHPFPVYLPQSHSHEATHGRVSFFDLDAGNSMHPYDISHSAI